MYTKEQIVAHPCKQGFEKKGATQIDAENMKNSGDETDRTTMRSTTHAPNYDCVQTKKGKTQLLKSRQRNQGYQKTWSAQRIQTISKHASRPLSQNMTVDCSYNSRQKLRDPWPSENAETQKLLHTEGRKITSTLTKMSRPCRHITKHGSFHISRCAVTADVLKTLPLYAMRENSPERHVPSVLASVPR